MDARIFYYTLGTNVLGIAIFSVIMQLAFAQTSLGTLAAFAGIAILSFVLCAIASVGLMIDGLVRRKAISHSQAGWLGVASFGLGTFALISAFLSSLQFQDSTAACGGFPPGYWTGVNATVNRCSIWATTHQDWAAGLFVLVLLVSAVIFSTCVFTRLQIMKKSEENGGN